MYIPRIYFQSSHSSWLLIYVRDDPLGHLLWGEDEEDAEDKEDEEVEEDEGEDEDGMTWSESGITT